MDWKTFAEFYTANFGRLTESDGLPEWARFIKEEVADVGVLRQALQPVADRFAAALDNMDSNVRKPTLAQVRKAYYSELARRRQERDRHVYNGRIVCGVCRGAGLLYVLAPLADDPDGSRAPEDFRKADWENFRGVEVAKCPQCSGVKYSPLLRRRIENNGLPIVIPRNHPDFPPDLDPRHEWTGMPGDNAMLVLMRNNGGVK